MRSSACSPAAPVTRARASGFIAQTFVEAHGQRIWVDDAPHGGARFWFTLPTAQLIPEEPPRGAGARH